MKKNKIDKQIKEYFKGNKLFTREELFKFYSAHEPDLKVTTFNWRLYDLKRNNLIQEVKQGIYRVSQKQLYKPQIEDNLKEIYSGIIKEYRGLKPVIWSTFWVNRFSVQQLFHGIIIIEVEGGVTESLFYKMKEMGIPNVYLKPDTMQLSRYAIGDDVPIVIKTLITKSPVQTIEKIKVPTLEKILVDLYCDEKTFYMFQGHELKEIYRNAIDSCTINFTKMLRYSFRRGKETELKEYLKKNFSYELEGILNDQ